MRKKIYITFITIAIFILFMGTSLFPCISGKTSENNGIQIQTNNDKINNIFSDKGNDYWLQTTDEDFNSGEKIDIKVSNDSFFLNRTIYEIDLIDDESFENEWPPLYWRSSGEWNKEGDRVNSGAYSADCDGGFAPISANLETLRMDCSIQNISEIYVSFWGYDEGSDEGDYYLDYFNGDNWNEITRLDNFGEGYWEYYYDIITDPQYFVKEFSVRWRVNQLVIGEHVYVDDVNIGIKQEKFAMSGSLISQSHDTIKLSPDYSEIKVNKSLPSGTSITTWMRAADTELELEYASWYTDINQVPNKRWIQWNVQLDGDGNYTPTVYDVNISWTFADDEIPPFIEITNPELGYLYFNLADLIEFKILFRFPFFPIIIIGRINIEVTAYDNESGLEKVEFYIDDELRWEDPDKPYNWTWTDNVVFFPYTITVIAYDYYGNQNSEEIKVWKIF